MVTKGQKILHNHYISNEELHQTDDVLDIKFEYLNDLLIPQTTAHKSAVCMVKTAVGNHKYVDDEVIQEKDLQNTQIDPS